MIRANPSIYRAINRIAGMVPELTEFSVKPVTEGIDAQGDVTIRIEQEGRTYTDRTVVATPLVTDQPWSPPNIERN